MARGTALAARWGIPAEQLGSEALRAVVQLEASYVAAGLRNSIYAITPERIVIGGGLTGLFPLVRSGLSAALAGPAGALILAKQAIGG